MILFVEAMPKCINVFSWECQTVSSYLAEQEGKPFEEEIIQVYTH